MITLTRKLKKDATEPKPAPSNNTSKRVSVRDKLLVKEASSLFYSTVSSFISCDISFYYKAQVKLN